VAPDRCSGSSRSARSSTPVIGRFSHGIRILLCTGAPLHAALAGGLQRTDFERLPRALRHAQVRSERWISDAARCSGFRNCAQRVTWKSHRAADAPCQGLGLPSLAALTRRLANPRATRRFKEAAITGIAVLFVADSARCRLSAKSESRKGSLAAPRTLHQLHFTGSGSNPEYQSWLFFVLREKKFRGAECFRPPWGRNGVLASASPP
jgi:hypothetical protein